MLRLWRRLRTSVADAWYRTIVRFPMSSQDKWQGLNDLLVQLVHAGIQRDGMLPDGQDSSLPKALETAASRWMWRRSDWLANSAAQTSALDDLLTVTFKTLNMTTLLELNGTTLKATTFYCPFIENTRRGEPVARRICERMCSERHSLFKGLTQGLPLTVKYLSPRKMGWGDEHCVKVFRLLSDGRE